MRKNCLIVLLLAIASILLFAACAAGGEKKAFSTQPRTNQNKKWRIGYYEGGDYTNYYKYLYAMTKGLMDLGWIEFQPGFNPDNDTYNTRQLWKYLAANIKSEYIEFVPDAYYSAGWDENTHKEISEKILTRLAQDKDIDLMLAMGTWAGKDLANNRHRTNTMVISTSDPVGSGIIKSTADSGFDHVHARVDPFRYERQVQIFHDTIGFRKLGIAYENSVVGRSYAAVDTIEKVAAERGFDIVECYTLGDIADEKVSGESVAQCFEKMASQVDAIYVTVQSGINEKSIPDLVKIANDHKVPTFSQFGSKEVRYGFLMSISRAGEFKPEGRFLAATAAQIFNGAKPRQLNQIFEEAPDIAINLKTAELIGFYLHADLLAAADEIYREISKP